MLITPKKTILTLALLSLAACSSAPKKGTDEVVTDFGIDRPTETVESKYEDDLKNQQYIEASSTESTEDEHSPEAYYDETNEVIISSAQEAGKDYGKAIKAMAKGDTEEALELLTAISKQYPDLSGPLVNQAIIHLQNKNYTLSAEANNKALEINPNNPYALNLKGILFRDQGKFVQAKESYLTAIRIDPQYAKAHYNMAVLAELYLQDVRLALTHFQIYQSLQKEPERMVSNWIKDLNRRAEALIPIEPVEAVAGQDGLNTTPTSNENPDQLTETTSTATVVAAQGE